MRATVANWFHLQLTFTVHFETSVARYSALRHIVVQNLYNYIHVAS